MPEKLPPLLTRIGALRQEGRLNLLFNVGWSGASQAARAAALAVVTIAVTRHLGPQGYGVFALAMAVVKIAMVLAGLGLERVVVRQLVLQPAGSRAILRRAFLLRAGFGAAAYVGACASVRVFLADDSLIPLLVAIAGIGIVSQSFESFEAWFQAQGLMKLAFLGRTIPVLIAAAVKVGAVALGATIMTFAVLEAVESVLISVGVVLIYRSSKKGQGAEKPAAPAPAVWETLGQAFPLAIAALAVSVYVRSDVIMLGTMIESSAAGIYSAAAQVSELWGIIPMAVAPAIFPALLRARETCPKSYHIRFQLLVQGATATACVIALNVTLLAPTLVVLLYGDAYTASTAVLRIHVWSVVFVFLGVAQSLWDAGEGLFWFTCLRTVLGAICNIGLNLVLIPASGAVGAAVATLISYALAGFLLNAAMRRTRPLFLMQMKALCLLPLAGWLRQRYLSTHPAAPR